MIMVVTKRIQRESKKFLKIISGVDPSDIPALGKCLNYVDSLPLERLPENHPVISVIPIIKKYIERIILDEEKDLNLLVSCVEKLSVTDDYEESNLRGLTSPLALKNEPDWFGEQAPGFDEFQGESDHADYSDDDVQILSDFVVESLEGIDAIECSLVDFESDPSNQAIINSIFRIFHTIKGVSGFLNLEKINSLSHSTENLLDEIRHGNLKVSRRIIDVIFSSVDSLKKMIAEIRDNLESGKSWRESRISIAELQREISAVQKIKDDGEVLPLGEILVVTGVVTRDDLEESLEIQKMSPDQKLGEILVESSRADSDSVNSAVKSQHKEKSQVSSQVKIDTVKLDTLVDLTGELVIAQSMLKQYSQKMIDSDPAFHKFMSHLTSSVSGIQKIAMNMRMVPIRSTFQKMVRVVRDLSKSSGKEIVLLMTGEDTEIDRNMVEALYEPMVHMIRNSADHGLETREERLAAGKTSHGTIYLRAFHRGGNMVIEIEDDGRGLNRDKILEKAVSKGLVSSSESLADSQVYNLVFEPGFSTASAITDISGRGVGMDVVKQSIEKLKGTIFIDSELGKGCRFSLALPLTMGIIEGMLIKAGKERYIVPTLSVLESFRPSRDDYKTSFDKGEVLFIRGSLIPLVRLADIFGIRSEIENPWDGIVIVIENKGAKIGLLVDNILGKDEFVIKSLGPSFRHIKGIAGGSIMADGRVALIMDVVGIFDMNI